MIRSEHQDIVDQVIGARRSVRAFLDKPIQVEDIAKILEVAAKAPSGANLQPWKVYVLMGQIKKTLSEAILKAFNDPKSAAECKSEYSYYPQKWISPYVDRRRKVGWDLYGLLGLTRENKTEIHQQHGRNYLFFDAPVGLIFTIDRIMEQGSWLDYGMFLQNIMLVARARGMDTCAQASFNDYHKIITSILKIPENEMLVCGMSLGFADETKIENALVTERTQVTGFVKFMM